MPKQRKDVLVHHELDGQWRPHLNNGRLWTMYPIESLDDETSNQVLFDSGVSMIVSIPVKSLRCELVIAYNSNTKAILAAQESGSLEDVGALYLERNRIWKEIEKNPLQRKRLTIRLQQRHPIGVPFMWGGQTVTIVRVTQIAAANLPTPCRTNNWEDLAPMETL